MDSKILSFAKNFSYTILSNFISLFISTLVILIVPKIIGIDEYGYWQLYLFYINYTGFFHLGWIDGIYLKYGGKHYNDINKESMFYQFWMLVILQLIIAILIILFSYIKIVDVDKRFILNMMALCCIIHIPRTMLSYILQATNRIKDYAIITMIDRSVYCILIIFLLFIGINNYKLMIISDLLGRILALLYAVYICKDIIFTNIRLFKIPIREILDNINIGIKLMFANVASMLIIGIVRFGIENTWDVSTFAQVSLTMSICNIMLVFINTIGIIMFPILRRMEKNSLSKTYNIIRTVLIIPMLGLLILYYPLKFILSIWLPHYASGLTYMAILFPICIYEGKMSLLINTYLKTLRKEKSMLFINVITVCLSLISTGIIVIYFKNLNLAVFSITILLAFRSLLAEKIVTNIICIKINKDIWLEIIITSIFIIVSWFFNEVIAMIIYLIIYILYIFIKKNDILYVIKILKKLIKS